MRRTERRIRPVSASRLRRACQMRNLFPGGGLNPCLKRSLHVTRGHCGGTLGPRAAISNRLACSGIRAATVEVTPVWRRLRLATITSNCWEARFIDNLGHLRRAQGRNLCFDQSSRFKPSFHPFDKPALLYLIKDGRIEQPQSVRGRCRSFSILFGNLGDDKLETSCFR
jgi:hypothetical protein